MVKWRLFLTTLPFAFAMVGAAYVIHDLLHIPYVADFRDLAPLVTGTILIAGFMLAGVLADYKQSESLPAALFNALDVYRNRIENIQYGQGREKADMPALRRAFLDLVITIEDWLITNGPVEKCYSEIEDINTLGTQTSDMAMYQRGCMEASVIQGYIARIETIRNTSFIQSGYALLEILTASMLVLLLASDFHDSTTACLVIGILSLAFIYLYRLIKDLDDPFEYQRDGSSRGAAEVSISPIINYRRQLQTAMQQQFSESAAWSVDKIAERARLEQCRDLPDARDRTQDRQ